MTDDSDQQNLKQNNVYQTYIFHMNLEISVFEGCNVDKSFALQIFPKF